MASTNPFQDANDDQLNGPDETGVDAAPGRGRGASKLAKLRRRASRAGQRRQRDDALVGVEKTGLPELEGLKPVLGFLAFPAVLVIAITATGGGWPSYILYPIALILGLFVAISAFRGVELVLACMIIYLPFSKSLVVPLAPGVNGTNMLVLLGLFAALLRAAEVRKMSTKWPPGTFLVLAFGLLTSLSALTISLIPGGRTYLLYNELLSYKAWVDQFIFYFIALMCIRDKEAAKRCFVYLLIGSVLVVLYSVPEMLEKSGRSTIDKSRIGGPHLQSNNFGGFVAYSVLPLLAVFIMYIKDLRAWLLTPYFLLTAKVLITTFSRGAYVAMVLGGVMAGWFKGRSFLFSWVAFALCFFLVFPSFIPESISARMGSLTSDVSSSAGTEETLDKSSQTRLVMWRAAAVMISEDPVWGKGFKGFPFLKNEYTEIAVVESDPHSMYLYIGSQMGLPALSLFLLILGYSFYLGRLHSRNKTDRFVRAIGIGGASATACYAVVCIFGSRAVSLDFTAYFWAMLVIMQVLKQKQIEAENEAKGAKPKRSNAFDQSRMAQNATATESMANFDQQQGEPAVENSSFMDEEFTNVNAEMAADSQRLAPDTNRTGVKLRERNRKTMRGAAAHQAACAAQSSKTNPADQVDAPIPSVPAKRRSKR